MSDRTLSPTATQEPDGPPPTARHGHFGFVRSNWFLVLVVGSILWLFAAVITGITADEILMPTVILIGSFLAPVAVVTFALSRLDHSALGPHEIFGGFLAGGTLGVLTSALIETYLLPSANGTFLAVGLIEEGCKAAVLVGVAHFVHPRRPRDGMVLGAIVGAGFAAFESAGYAFYTIIKHSDDHPVLDVFNTELTRGLLSPFGHITWTALVGGALFFAAKGGRFRITGGLIGTFIGVVLLHAAWDASTGVGVIITHGVVDGMWNVTWPNTQDWIGTPTSKELVVWQVVYDGLLFINAVIGVSWIVHNWRKYSGHEPVADEEQDTLAAAPV